MIIPTYAEYQRALDLGDWQVRLSLIRERDELEEQRDAALQLARILVRHQRDLISTLLDVVRDLDVPDKAILDAEQYLRHVSASVI